MVFVCYGKGSKHSIYTNDVKTIPLKRHPIFDRITASELCKQAGYPLNSNHENHPIQRLDAV